MSPSERCLSSSAANPTLHSGQLRPGVVLAVPVRHGRVTGVTVGVPDFSKELLDLMLQQRLRRPEGGGAIMDRRGLYIARTLNPEQTVGQQAGAAFLERALASTEGIVRNVNREGQAVYATFVHTSFGWIAAIGVPASAIEEPARRGLITMIALSFSGLLVAVGREATVAVGSSEYLQLWERRRLRQT